MAKGHGNRKIEVEPEVRALLEMSVSSPHIEAEKPMKVLLEAIERLERGYYDDKIKPKSISYRVRRTVNIPSERADVLRQHMRAFGYETYNDFIKALIEYEYEHNWEKQS